MIKIIFINKKYFLSTVIFAAIFGMMVISSFAETTVKIEPPTEGDIMDLFNRIMDFILKISIPIAAIIIMVGGIQMATAGGNEEKIKKAQKTITWAIVGFAIILLSKGLVLVIKEFLGVEVENSIIPSSGTPITPPSGTPLTPT